MHRTWAALSLSMCVGDCYGEGMYCGQESPSPSRPDSASGRGHPCKVTFMLQICSCHAPVSGPSVASCSFRPKTNILAHLQGEGPGLSPPLQPCLTPSSSAVCLQGPWLPLRSLPTLAGSWLWFSLPGRFFFNSLHGVSNN